MKILNRITLIGNVGQAPEFRSYSQKGVSKTLATFSLATHEKIKNEERPPVQETHWHPVAVFDDGLVTLVKDHVKKDSFLLVEGALKPRTWENKQGVLHRTYEVQVGSLGGYLHLLKNPHRDTEEQKELPHEAFSEALTSHTHKTPPAPRENKRSA